MILLDYYGKPFSEPSFEEKSMSLTYEEEDFYDGISAFFFVLQKDEAQ